MAYNKILYTRTNTLYTDLDISFKASPGTGDLLTKTDVDAVKQSYKNILFTNYLERPYTPYIAGDINKLLFNQRDRLTDYKIRTQLINILNTYEVRGVVTSVDVIYPPNNQAIDITINFVMINNQNPQSLNVILTRRR